MPNSSTREVVINLDLTLKDHLRCELFHSRAYFISCVIVVVAFILTGAAVGGFLTSLFRFLLFLLIGFLLGLVAPIRSLLSVCYMWFRGYMPKQMTVTVSDNGLVYSIGEDYRVTSEWPQVEVYEKSDYFFLWSGKYHLPMPKRCFAEGQAAAFTAALSKNLQQEY